MTAIKLQRQYFELLDQYFVAATGVSPDALGPEASIDEIRDVMIQRLRHEPESFRREITSVSEQLVGFYKENTQLMLETAKFMGGTKLVLGGASGFGATHESSVRKMLLYCDCVLVPDPVSRFFEADRFDQAIYLQIALHAYQLLKLRALVALDLPNPPLLVFPSIERALEENDPVTRASIEQLLVNVVNGNCGANLTSLEEVFDYAAKSGEAFLAGAAAGKLLLAPGAEVSEGSDPRAMIRTYLADLEGRRDPRYLAELRKVPEAVVGAQLLTERLARQFHLLDNANSFAAQPMVTAAAQWHYYELAAKASMDELVRESVMSRGAFSTLRSIQDPNLKWLGNIPADVIADLLQRGENRELRRRLEGFTKQLHSISPGDVEATTREVMFGINALINEHQQEIEEIQRRYGPKYKNALLMGLVSAATFLPVLTPLVGSLGPVLAGGGVAAGYVRDKLQELGDKRKARSSLLGVLAAASLARKR